MIKNITIKGYRGISHLQLDDLSPINIFVGYNGVGKTTILEAISLLVARRERMLVYLASQRDTKEAPLIVSSLFNRSGEDEADIRITASGSPNRDMAIRAMNDREAQALYKFHELEHIKEALPPNNVRNIPGVEVSYAENSNTVANSKYAVHRDHFHFEESGVETKSGGVFFISSRTRSSVNESAEMFSEIQDNGKEEELFKYLRMLVPDLLRIRNSFSNRTNRIVVDFKSDVKMRGVPVNDLGDGFSRLLLILTGIYSSHSKYLVVDDIDSGFHYTAMDKVWNALSQLAVKDKQIFCVTHNDEMLDSLLSKDVKNKEAISIFRISKDNSNCLKSIKYDIHDFEKSVKHGLPVR